MDALLLDTDVFSFLMKGRDERAEAYRSHIQGKTIAVSFVTVGEIHFGAAKRGWASKRIRAFSERLKAVVVVPSDNEVCKKYGQLKAELQSKGIVVSDNDLWIAACAIRHSVVLVSNNRRHFQNIPELNLLSLAPEVPPAKRGLF
jgi:tRNA(fMet)-specific endonuclease VapC